MSARVHAIAVHNVFTAGVACVDTHASIYERAGSACVAVVTTIREGGSRVM